MSFETGCFPSRLKLSTITPLFKKGDRYLVKNYRPITLIPVLSKIYEKAIHRRLIDFFDKYKIIAKEQFGFQKHKSTEAAVFDLVTNITHNVSSKLQTSALFFDMSRAFDFVSHKILLNKLKKCGIRGIANEWIRCYLLERQQCVDISSLNRNAILTSYKSRYRHNGCGVPQGSVLGPLLFLVYINDLPKAITHKCVLFADDICVNVVSKNAEIHNDDVNLNVKLVIEWLQLNNLTVNVTKTKFIQFANQGAKNINLHIKYKEETIDSVSSTKFLGIEIDKYCNWKDHIENVCGKVNRFVYVLRRLRKTSDSKTTLMAYHGYVASNLRYGLIIWGNSSHFNSAFLAQKRCVRAIAGVPPWESCRSLFKELRILPLACMYIYEASNFVRKHSDKFIFSNRCRGPKKLIIEGIMKTGLFKRNCYCMCVRIFNTLPNTLKDMPLRRFKKMLYEFLILHRFYSLDDFFNCDKVIT